MKSISGPLFLFLVFVMAIPQVADSCTNLIVTRGATTDSSTFMVYTNDGEWLYHLRKTPAMSHKAGDSIEFVHWRTNTRGKIKQVSHTYATVGFHMNEHQVAVGETTFTGREELWNHSKFLQYWHLMQLALERASSAREAIDVITGLAEEYGYGSEGESFSIIDPDEAWILEMIGTGDGGEGAIWVARRIPDGYICAHANMARIGEFPLDDPENCIYSENVISFAVEKGYYDPDSGQPFRFNEVYNPSTPDRLKYCETRVWRLFDRIAPSLGLNDDYHRGVKGAQRYPLWIKPDSMLSLSDIINLVRDHYEGTPYDMTKGLAAGPFGNPVRYRPLEWEADGFRCSWERSVSTPNTAFSFIAQARSWLPDETGGVVWFGVDDTYTSCYFPVFCHNTLMPESFRTGDIKNFSWNSSWWAFNFVSNFITVRYSDMIKDVKKVQSKLEKDIIAEQDSLQRIVSNYKYKKRIKKLTEYTNERAALIHNSWVRLGEFLITKYNDGYIKNEEGHPETKGYPDEWYRTVVENEPGKYVLPLWKKNHKSSDLPF